MAFGLELYNSLPMEGLMLFHLVEVLFGFYLAKMALQKGNKAWMYLFLLYAASGVVFLLAHQGTLALPFAHLVTQVFMIAGFALVYLDLKKK
jgi:hypothetical protein